jgi:hypothetical protein
MMLKVVVEGAVMLDIHMVVVLGIVCIALTSVL